MFNTMAAGRMFPAVFPLFPVAMLPGSRQCGGIR